GVGVWNECIETYFIGLIEDEVKKGNRPTTTLIKPSWKFIRQKLKEMTKKDYSQDQVKNKYNQLRINGRSFKHKSAKTFRKKGCKHYDKLYTIFGDTTATGGSSHHSTQSPSNMKKKMRQMEKLVIQKKKMYRDLKPRKPRLVLILKNLRRSENSGNHLNGNNQDLLIECIDTLSTLERVDGASFATATKIIHDYPL
ncbi:L10-interacting MYB domain-containing protein, partial [Bienertia sinuspersici]